MPIEIREIVIKTDVKTANGKNQSRMSISDLDVLKKKVLIECKQLLIEQTKRKTNKR